MDQPRRHRGACSSNETAGVEEEKYRAIFWVLGAFVNVYFERNLVAGIQLRVLGERCHGVTAKS